MRYARFQVSGAKRKVSGFNEPGGSGFKLQVAGLVEQKLSLSYASQGAKARVSGAKRRVSGFNEPGDLVSGFR